MEPLPAAGARVADALRRLGPLPVLGGTVARVRALAEDPASSTADLVAAVEADEAFAANLLRYANSAAAARPVRARTIRQAVTIAGRRPLARLAVEATTYRFLEAFPGVGGSRGALHVHAVTVAAYAAEAAQRTGAHVGTAHLAGLLHDVGKLLMPVAFGERAVARLAAEAPHGAARAALERERLGVDHAHAGSLLVGLSDPSDAVVRAIAAHHGGLTGAESPSREAACVQVADQIARLLDGGPADAPVLDAALARLGAGAALLDEVAEAASAVPERPEEPLAEAVGRLERLARTDDLTGLANRRDWLERVRHDLAGGREGVLLLCDVDGFKAVNDVHGHRTGDLVLTEVARVLGRHGFAGRLGGDEFGVWLPGGRPASAQASARALMEEVAGSLQTPDTAIGLTVGAAAGAGGEDVMELLEVADRALYLAKPGGRGR